MLVLPLGSQRVVQACDFYSLDIVMQVRNFFVTERKHHLLHSISDILPNGRSHQVEVLAGDPLFAFLLVLEA